MGLIDRGKENAAGEESRVFKKVVKAQEKFKTRWELNVPDGGAEGGLTEKGDWRKTKRKVEGGGKSNNWGRQTDRGSKSVPPVLE